MRGGKPKVPRAQDGDVLESNRSSVVNAIGSNEVEDDVDRKPMPIFRHHALEGLEALTVEQTAELADLQVMTDADVDCGDIPPLTEAFWKNAICNPFYKPTKTSTTLRIDSDVLAWLRTGGKGYQSRINAILRREMLAALKQ